ncbi:MAG: alpha/beta hydrolase [Pseudobdellovibrionaceae bacterium]
MKNRLFLPWICFVLLLTQFSGATPSYSSLDKLISKNDNLDGFFAFNPSESIQKQGVVLLVHGLNTKPQKMNSIANVLKQHQMDVFQIHLSGHQGDIEKMKLVTLDIWQRDFAKAYIAAKNYADSINKPLYFVGFSLGAALATSMISEYSIQFEKMVLFAPAIAIHKTSEWIKYLFFWGLDTVIPSLSPESYRANSEGTTLAAYKALLQLTEANKNSAHKTHQLNVPTLVFIDPEDELVSDSGLKKFKADQNLNQWQFFEITNIQHLLKKSYHHLIIDEDSLGPVVWKKVSTAMVHHLLGKDIAIEKNMKARICDSATIWSTSRNKYCKEDFWPSCDRKIYSCNKDRSPLNIKSDSQLMHP